MLRWDNADTSRWLFSLLALALLFLPSPVAANPIVARNLNWSLEMKSSEPKRPALSAVRSHEHASFTLQAEPKRSEIYAWVLRTMPGLIRFGGPDIGSELRRSGQEMIADILLNTETSLGFPRDRDSLRD